MTAVAQGLASAIEVLRVVFLVAAGLLALICVLDWAVRTRRISPFSPVARFARKAIDPLIAPVERRVVRAGGLPSSAPLWALGAAVLAGIIVLTLLGFLRSQLVLVSVMAAAGPRGILALVVSWIFALLRIALLVRVISSWVRVSPYSPFVRWSYTLTEPMLRPLRGLIPSLGPFDITPILAYFALALLEGVVVGAIAP